MKFDYSLLKSCGQDVLISDNVMWKRPSLADVGSHVAVDDFTVITTAVDMRDYIHIHCHISIIGGADAKFVIGNFCTISAGARVIVRGDEFRGAGLVGPIIPDEYRDNLIGQLSIMGSFSALGTNAILMPKVSLAMGVVVGANSLVTKTIEEPWGIYYGTPAKRVKDRPKEKMLAFARELGYQYE